jgi:hypothetical protein
MSVFQRFRELDIARGEFSGQRVGVGDADECVPPGDPLLHVPGVVRYRSNADVFEQDLRTAPAHDAEEDVVPFKGDLESKPVSVERK